VGAQGQAAVAAAAADGPRFPQGPKLGLNPKPPLQEVVMMNLVVPTLTGTAYFMMLVAFVAGTTALALDA
jgi:hypothetical protein